MERAKLIAKYNKICQFCGEEFLAAVDHAKFCSDTCRVKAHHKRKAEERCLAGELPLPECPYEITYIREYMGWNGMTIKKVVVESLKKRIEKDNAAGRFSIQGKYGEEVKHVHKELTKLLNETEVWPAVINLDLRDKQVLGDDLYEWFE